MNRRFINNHKPICICIIVLASLLNVSIAKEKPLEEKSSGIYFEIEGGASISHRMLLAPDWPQNGCTTYIWYPTGSDSFETDLGTSKCIGFKIGYQINPIISCDMSYDYRGQFSSLRGYEPNLIASSSFSLGDIFSFNNITIQTVLFNINLSPDLDWGGFVPYISAGAGFASNKIGCLKNYNLNQGEDYPLLYDVTLRGRRINCFSWQAGIGAYYAFHNQWRFGMGYRFLDVGKLSTGGYTTGYALGYTNNSVAGTTMRFVARHPSFSELLLSLTYCF